ncbi:restriction endonuclease [Nitrosomonas sp. Nm58]|uniref:restriction endonuclease n=1 Tax=Nitrosomonas sp. Nm58 TaxID=200126 RepID=UPI00089A2C24|nr:restriction endonuclease [Nitrosomonas sp. Nm58]SDY14916.1 restriction system protein [Nitrosomonas sp. Nm58]
MADHLHEIVGYKAGVAASIEHLCDLLGGTCYSDLVLEAEGGFVRIRSEDYEELYFTLLHKVGLTENVHNPIHEMFTFHNKLKDIGGDEFALDILNIYNEESKIAAAEARVSGKDMISPEGIIRRAYNKYGKRGLDAVMLAIEYYESARVLNPHSSGRYVEWGNIQNLAEIFIRSGQRPVYGTFFDQRLINYLSVNSHQLGSIHWRKFEELIAECFQREGFDVEIGPGTNDDGVDIRVWIPGQREGKPPEYLIQCKRQKDKIDKVTVKGLYADVAHEEAGMGLLVTTSEFSPGARSVVSARGYPVSEVNGEMLSHWLIALRKPGTGIVRV